MFFNVLQSYYGPVTTLLIFAVMIITDKLFPKRIKQLFLMELGINFLIILATWMDRCLSILVLGGLAWKLRTVTTYINFAFSPCAPMILVLIYKENGMKGIEKLFFLPEIFNICMCLLSIGTGCIFYIGNQNCYRRGPFFFIPFVVTAFYLLSMIFSSARQENKPNRKEETILLSVIMGVIGLATVLEVIFQIRFMVWSTTEICVILYFLYLNIQNILYDPLTGCYSRRAYENQLKKINSRSSCTVAMIDLDELKKFNDRFSHYAGDQAICGITNAIFQTKQKSMDLYRYGGDEFILLSNHLCGDEIEKVLLEAQDKCGIIEGIPLTFSFGIAEYHIDDDLHSTILRADANMYQRKKNMRNFKKHIQSPLTNK